MSDAREQILQRLRHGAAAPLHRPNHRAEREREWWARQPEMTDPAARFLAELDAVGTPHVEIPDWAAVPAAVGTWMAEYGVRSVMTGAVPALDPLREHLAGQHGITLHSYTDGAEAQQEALFSVDCGITTVQAGIAETGSLLLVPDAAQPRLLSLAMPIHVALLERQALVPTLARWLENGEYRAEPPSNLVLVSGASRTADIELILSVGVHGPKVLLVALIG